MIRRSPVCFACQPNDYAALEEDSRLVDDFETAGADLSNDMLDGSVSIALE